MRPGKVWYGDNARFRLFTRYRQVAGAAPIPLMWKKEFRTVLIDLEKPDSDLFADCSSNCRNEIRRGDREGLSFYAHTVSPQDLAFFNTFMASRDLGRANPVYAGDVNALVTGVSLSDTLLVSHLYLMVPQYRRARLIYSALNPCPDRHASPTEADHAIPWPKLTGIANRWLHYRDFSFLRESGMVSCDLGGLGKNEADPKIAGINRFKRSLGGKEVVEFNYDPLPIALLDIFFSFLRKLGGPRSRTQQRCPVP